MRLLSQANRSHSRPTVKKYSSRASSDSAGGPELPFGRKARSTRNTKPCSVVSVNKPEIARTALAKYSWLLMLPRPYSSPCVSPSSSYKKIRSISLETLSSRAPSLPMPTTSRWARGLGAGVCWRCGMPCKASSCSSAWRMATASANCAKAVITPVTSDKEQSASQSSSISRSSTSIRHIRKALAVSKPFSCKAA